MKHLITSLLQRLQAFERWFARHCGWFFTNGMKATHQHKP